MYRKVLILKWTFPIYREDERKLTGPPPYAAFCYYYPVVRVRIVF